MRFQWQDYGIISIIEFSHPGSLNRTASSLSSSKINHRPFITLSHVHVSRTKITVFQLSYFSNFVQEREKEYQVNGKDKIQQEISCTIKCYVEKCNYLWYAIRLTGGILASPIFTSIYLSYILLLFSIRCAGRWINFRLFSISY